jgi:hypothetical protein
MTSDIQCMKNIGANLDEDFIPGQLVWKVGVNENIYTPYRVTKIWEDENIKSKHNKFAYIIPGHKFLDNHDWGDGERMNFVWLSTKHPLGWKIILPDGKELK